MLTIDNLTTSSAAVAVLDEATNFTIAFGRFVYYLGTLAYLCGRETRRYYESELLQQIETIVGILLWLIHWFQPDTSTSTNSLLIAPEVEATKPVLVEPVAAIAHLAETRELAVEPAVSLTPEPVATLAEPTVAAVEPSLPAMETVKSAASTNGKRRTTASKTKAQAKSTNSSRSKTKRSTT